MKVIICKGLPASGKSTWAREQCERAGFKRINKDDLRRMLDNGQFSRANEKTVEESRDALLLELLGEQHNVIIDDTNFDPRHEARIREVARLVKGVDVEVKFFDVPLHECLARNALRTEAEGKVPPSVIKNMHRKWLWKHDQSGYAEQDRNLRPATIFDIDGTLALATQRGPYEHEKCETDEVNEPVAEMVYACRERGDTIIFLSGRSAKHREATSHWLLDRRLLIYNHELLLMRAEDDNRDDALIKRELYEQHVKGEYFVRCVFDDRDKVVRMWREIGLPCFQVRSGDF